MFQSCITLLKVETVGPENVLESCILIMWIFLDPKNCNVLCVSYMYINGKEAPIEVEVTVTS